MKLDASQLIESPVNRRSFLKNVGGTTAAIAALGIAPTALFADTPITTAVDTPKEIFTAALVAEDLAITFYYNVLIGRVIQDANLSGPGGTATHVQPSGSVSNVAYIRAAITEEVTHANLFRTLLGIKSPAMDPYQTFYFPTETFYNLGHFVGMLQALESAFIGAYMAAIQQFALRAAGGPQTLDGVLYQPSDFAYFAKIASSILGVESEHRALGRAISPNLIPANQLNYEITDGIETVYNGPKSAVAALTPFLSWKDGYQAFSLKEALANAAAIGIKTYGTIPNE